MKRLYDYTFMLLLALWGLVGCDKPPTNGGNGDGNGNDTIPTTMPQEQIPWPSLADSPWPMFRHDPQGTGRSPFSGSLEGEIAWAFEAQTSVFSSPIIGADGMIYFGSADSGVPGVIYAVRPDGTLQWTFPAGELLGTEGLSGSGLVAADGTIYFPVGYLNRKGYLCALNPDGSLRWFTDLEGGGGFAPNISRDGRTIYIIGGGDHLYEKNFLNAIHTTNGVMKWRFQPADSVFLRYGPTIAPDDGTIYVVGSNSRVPDIGEVLYAVDTSGALQWSYAPGPATSGELSTPVVDNAGNIYVNLNGVCIALNPEGTVRWSVNLEGGRGIAIGPDGTLYALGYDGYRLYALDYGGQVKWNLGLGQIAGLEQDNKIAYSTPSIDSRGNLYLGTATWRNPADSLNFFALTGDGALKFALSLPSPDGSIPDIDTSPAIDAEGNIYVGSDRPSGHHVYKIH